MSDADLVKELRQQARNRTERFGDGSESVTAEWRAADRIEALAAEVERLRLKHVAATEHNKISLQFLAEETKHRISADCALVEALEERDRLRDDIRQLWNFGIDELRICEHCDAWLTTEEAARIEDVALCPREAFGSAKFPNEKCFQHRAWIVKEEQESAVRRAESSPTEPDAAG